MFFFGCCAFLGICVTCSRVVWYFQPCLYCSSTNGFVSHVFCSRYSWPGAFASCTILLFIVSFFHIVTKQSCGGWVFPVCWLAAVVPFLPDSRFSTRLSSASTKRRVYGCCCEITSFAGWVSTDGCFFNLLFSAVANVFSTDLILTMLTLTGSMLVMGSDLLILIAVWPWITHTNCSQFQIKAHHLHLCSL